LGSLVTNNPQIRAVTENYSKALAKELHNKVGTEVENYGITQVDFNRGVSDDDLPRVTQVQQGLEHAQYLLNMIRQIPANDRDRLSQEMADYLGDQRFGQARRMILERVFQAGESMYINLGEVLSRTGNNVGDLGEVLNDESIYGLLTFLAAYPDRYRFQLGELLTSIRLDNIPEKLQRLIAPLMGDYECKLKPDNGSWYLCGQAEPRLKESLRKQAVVLVVGGGGEPLILVKFQGKFSGICLQNVQVGGGTMLAGNWYSPTDSDLKRLLRTAFDAGTARVTLGRGEWTIMRGLREYDGEGPESQLDRYREYARQLPENLPRIIDGVDRARWRQTSDEVHG